MPSENKIQDPEIDSSCNFRTVELRKLNYVPTSISSSDTTLNYVPQYKAYDNQQDVPNSHLPSQNVTNGLLESQNVPNSLLQSQNVTNSPPQSQNVVSIVNCSSRDSEEELCGSDLLLKNSTSSGRQLICCSSQDRFPKKSAQELNSLHVKELQMMLTELTQIVEGASNELVQLLLENDTLQQESDARNVAIEQLLKMTVKNPDLELGPIQMSVVLASDESNEEDS